VLCRKTEKISFRLTFLEVISHHDHQLLYRDGTSIVSSWFGMREATRHVGLASHIKGDLPCDDR
jgi:hypothetical protein